jgi:tetratricopeptide (TPR) repeat protein
MAKDLKARRTKAQIIPFIQSGEYYFKKGLRAYRQRDLYKAKKYLERAMMLKPNDPIIICQLAVVHTEIGEYQQSNLLLTLILEKLDPNMADCYYFLANNYAYLGLFQEAHKYAKKYLEKEPDGEFAEDTEDLIELLSIEAEEEGHPINDEDELILKQEKAKDLLEKGKLFDAIDVLKQIIAEYPEFWSAYNNLALAYFYLGDVEKATSIIEGVLRKNPGNLHALCNLLVFFYYERKDDKVAELVSQLECVHPMLTEHRYKLGATFGLIGRYDLAYKWLRNLYKYGFDGDATFYYWLAHSAYFNGNIQFAKDIWEKVVQLNPSKQAFAPWNVAGQSVENGITKQWITSHRLEERLYGLFLLSKSQDFNAVVPIEPKTETEKEFLLYLQSKQRHSANTFIADCCEIAATLYNYNKPHTEELLLTWFHIFVQSLKNKHFKLANHLAWAAATEYIWSKFNKKNITQKELAKKYDISPTTLAKYVKFVKEIL